MTIVGTRPPLTITITRPPPAMAATPVAIHSAMVCRRSARRRRSRAALPEMRIMIILPSIPGRPPQLATGEGP